MRYQIMFLIMLLTLSVNAQRNEAGILLVNPTRTEDVYTSAIRNYSNIIDEQPYNVKALLLRANLYETLNKPMEARMDRERALSINPYATLHVDETDRKNIFDKRKFEFASTNNSFSKSFLVEDEYEELINNLSNNEDLYFALKTAMVYIRNQDYENAALYLDRVTDVDSTPLYYDMRGIIELKNQNFGGAIEYFDKAVGVDPNHTVAYHNRAVAYKLLGYLDEAERDFRTALTQRSDIAKIHFGKASLYELKGDTENAQYYYKTAANVNQDYSEASLNNAVILKSQGQYTDALIQVTKLIDQTPDIAENYYVRGGIYFIRGEYSNAVDDFNEYLSYDKEDLTVKFYKGLALNLDGSKNRGCYEMQNSIDAGHENAKHVEIYMHMCRD